MGPGFLVAGLGMLLLTQLEIGSSYLALLLPAMVLLGLGMGTAFMPAMSLATQASSPGTPVSPPRWSTPRSRWAVRSAPPC